MSFKMFLLDFEQNLEIILKVYIFIIINMETITPEENNIIIYTNNDGSVQVETLIKDETVWLNQDQMATLFDKAKSTINEHIKNIYNEGELVESETLHKFGNSEFQQKAPNYYNLDVIISVGYRVKSVQGTQFRKRATQRIHEYIIK